MFCLATNFCHYTEATLTPEGQNRREQNWSQGLVRTLRGTMGDFLTPAHL